MPKAKSVPSRNHKYTPKVIARSMFDDDPILTTHHFRVPNTYTRAVTDVIRAYKAGIPFNRAVDQVFTLDPSHMNRNRLAEYVLRTIANEY